MFTAADFFDLDRTDLAEYLAPLEKIWQAVESKRRRAYVTSRLVGNVARLQKEGTVVGQTHLVRDGEIVWHGADCGIESGSVAKGDAVVVAAGERFENVTIVYKGAILFDDAIQLGNGSVIEAGAAVKGPTIIGDHTEIRHGAYVRGDVIIGNRCVLGHASEIKGSFMLDEAKAGHFAYVGDSILGIDTNLGAGTKLANMKFRLGTSSVKVRAGEDVFDTGLRKFGAVLGDRAETGCNAVCNPGTMIAPRGFVASGLAVHGFVPSGHIARMSGRQELKKLSGG